jgi:DNA-binding IclR family transcriptional regulator
MRTGVAEDAHESAARSVGHALDLLSLFDDDVLGLTVSEIARRAGIHRSTASRLAALLHRRGFLARSGQSYRPGNELVRLGALAVAGMDLVTHFRPVMERLGLATGETVDLGVPDGDAVLTVAEIPGTHLLSCAGWAGRRSPAHAASSGKVLLAFEALTPRYPLARYTPRTLTGQAALEEDLAEVRHRGWSAAVEEMEAGLVAVAAPAFDEAGNCIAALSVAGPAQRMDETVRASYAHRCVTAVGEAGPVRSAQRRLAPARQATGPAGRETRRTRRI